MDPLEEFLSPEALRLLLDSDDFATTVNEPSATITDHSLSIITPLAAGVNNPIPHEINPTRKRLTSDDNIPGCSTLVLDKGGSSKPKRARFSAEARAKVASVRKKGACMKCHRNKIPCSGQWPCESCCRSRAVVAGRASRHRWMDCVPFLMKDLDIFANGTVPEGYPTDELLRTDFGFALSNYSGIWIVEEGFTTATKSGAVAFGSSVDNLQMSFSTPLSQRLRPLCKFSISSCVDSRLERAFKLVIFVYLLTLSQKELHFSEDIEHARSVAGSNLIQCLEMVLSNSSTSKFGADALRALVRILGLAASVVALQAPRIQSFPDLYDRQQQLISVLGHHAVYIGERVDLWKGLDKGKVIQYFTSNMETLMPSLLEPKSQSYGNNSTGLTVEGRFRGRNGHGGAGNSFNQGTIVAKNTSRHATEHCNQPLEKTSAILPPVRDQRRRKFNRTMLYAEADTVFEPEVAWGIVQRYATAIYPHLPDTQPEDSHWTFSDHNPIGHAIPPNTAPSLHEPQTHTVCGWCGSFQISYKPSQGVVSCDICSTPYHANGFTPASWDLEPPRSTVNSINFSSWFDSFQGDSTNFASWPDVATSNSYGNDMDDFLWFRDVATSNSYGNDMDDFSCFKAS